MKKIFAAILAIAILVSIAVPVSVNAAAPKVTGLKQIYANGDTVKFQWTPVFGTDVVYEVQMGNSPDGLATVRKTDDWGSDETDYEYNNLESGSTYFARVRAKIESSYGEWSDVIELITRPDDVTNFYQSDCTDKTASFKWDAVQGATAYKIGELVNGKEHVFATVNKTSYTLTGLSNKTTFQNPVFVKSIKTNSTNTYTCDPEMSEWDYVKISAGDLRLTPSKLNTPSVARIWTGIQLIDFNHASGSVFGDVYQYEAYDYKNKVISKDEASAPSISAKNGQFYALRMRAYVNISNTDSKKYGPWSEKKYVGWGLNASAKKAAKKTQIKANWKKFKGASDYTVYISKSGKGGFKKVTTTKKTSIKIKKFGKKKLKKKTTYYVKIVANKKSGKKIIATSSNNPVLKVS